MEGKKRGNAAIALAVTYLASVTAPVAQYKVPALSEQLFAAFDMSGALFGTLMSSLTFGGLILAFPAAFISRKIGLKNGVIISVVFVALGNAISAIAPNIPVLLIARFFEGLGIGMMGVAAPAAVAAWFKDGNRGLALGIWSTWFPVGITATFNIVPSMAIHIGWRGVMVEGLILDIVALVLFVALFHLPKEEEGEDEENRPGFVDSFKQMPRHMIILGILFLIFSIFSLGIIGSFYNTYLMQARGITSVTASRITSVKSIAGIVIGPVGGFLLDRLNYKNRCYFMVGIFALYLIGNFFAWSGGVMSMWIFVCIISVAAGFAGGCLRPMVPIIAKGDGAQIALGMALMQFTQNLGSTIASPLFGGLSDSFGWAVAGNVMFIPLSLVAMALAFYMACDKRVSAKESAGGA